MVVYGGKNGMIMNEYDENSMNLFFNIFLII